VATQAREETVTPPSEPRPDDAGVNPAESSVPADRRDVVAGIGAQIRERRLAAGISQRGFARELGVSASFISQLENGKSQPAVGTLYLICSALEITLDELFATSGIPGAFDEAPRAARDTNVRIIRSATIAGGGATSDRARRGLKDAPTVDRGQLVTPEHRRQLVLDSGVIWEQLASARDIAVDFMFVRYDVGGSSTPDERLNRHSGVEYGYVINGELEITLGFESYRLGPGDAISFNSVTPHRLHNVGDVPVEAIWFVHTRTSARNSEPDASQSPAP
jgi:transcriptional regulator with XRE-family HTH domain/mannose-6-phosphate isomerase-like protein (cupin superfamily)